MESAKNVTKEQPENEYDSVTWGIIVREQRKKVELPIVKSKI